MLKTGDTSYSMIIQERGKKGAIVSTTDGTYLWSSVTHTFRDHVIQTFRGHVTQTFRGHSFRLCDNPALVFTILRDVATESRLLSGKVEVITSKVLA
jgi:hypothetical protein